VTRDDREIVSDLRRRLADRVGNERFELWWKNIDFQIDDSAVVVIADSKFTLDCLKSSHTLLVAAAQEVLGNCASVLYRVDSNPNAVPAPAARPKASERNQDTSKKTNQRPTRKPNAQPSLGSFVVGDGNRLSATAAKMVCDRFGTVSPLYVYGPTGTGKTHLLKGIVRHARAILPNREVVILSAEQFTSQFLEALQGAGLPSFRRKYRTVELLLIEDIQFFAGKRATLVELQYTLDTALRNGRQLVLSSDRSPAELSGFGPELTARLAGGLVTAVEPPDRMTRLGIFKQLVQQESLSVPDEVCELIATEISGDGRQLVGALNRLVATSQAMNKPITVALAQSALADLLRTTRRMLHLGDIEQAVCEVFGLERDRLKTTTKVKSISHPRMLAMWLARKYTRAAFSEIGEFFGRKSHSTVISAERRISRWVRDGEQIQMAHGTCHIEDAIRRVEGELRTG